MRHDSATPSRAGRHRGAAGRLAAGLAAAALVVSATPPAAGASGGPPTVSGRELRFAHPGQVLRHGDARAAGLTARHVARIIPDAARFTRPSPSRPQYAGASVLAAHNGVVVADGAVGHAVLYADAAPTLLPPARRVPARRDTIWDLASLSKLFTALVVTQLAERGRIALDAPAARHLPEFAQRGKAAITVRQLLTHTSGLPPYLPLWRDQHSYDERIAAVYAATPTAAPGTRYQYSDLNMITLGKLAERVAGQSLDRLVADRITRPLGMSDTGYNPPAAKLGRIAATEYQTATGRGMVRGSVHDENAWALNGVAGHAGVFSTTRDLAVLCQTLLNGGRYGRVRILSPGSVRSLLTDYNTAFPDDAHGLGFELGQRWYMDALSSPVAAGHTGFTGPSLVLDPLSDSFVILLCNRVHPSRDWGSDNPARRAVARDLALALPVRAPAGRRAWLAGAADPPGDRQDATLTAPLRVAVPAGGGELRFTLWYDTAAADGSRLEGSEDGVTWRQLPLRLRAPGHDWRTDGAFAGFEGRQWLTASAQLPAGVTTVRWRHTTDGVGHGRGVYLAGLMADAPGQPLFDERSPADLARLRANGWSRQPA